MFAVAVPDNLKPVVDQADRTDPRFNDAFREYAQARDFVIDPARVRHPQDKPRVERAVQYVRGNFFAGETFLDLADCRARAERWCSQVAGTRIHGSTRARPAEVFAAEEAPRLGPAPDGPFTIPGFTKPKVARDRHVEVARALYSVPGELIGVHIVARADATTVKLYHRGQLLKVHPRQEPGRRHTDPADLPSEVSAYALRDLDGLARRRLRTPHRRLRRSGPRTSLALDQDAPPQLCVDADRTRCPRRRTRVAISAARASTARHPP